MGDTLGDGRGKPKLEAGGSSGVGGGRFRGLSDTRGRSGLTLLPCDPADTLREESYIGEGSFPSRGQSKTHSKVGVSNLYILLSEGSATAEMRLEIEGKEGLNLVSCSILAVANGRFGKGRGLYRVRSA